MHMRFRTGCYDTHVDFCLKTSYFYGSLPLQATDPIAWITAISTAILAVMAVFTSNCTYQISFPWFKAKSGDHALPDAVVEVMHLEALDQSQAVRIQVFEAREINIIDLLLDVLKSYSNAWTNVLQRRPMSSAEYVPESGSEYPVQTTITTQNTMIGHFTTSTLLHPRNHEPHAFVLFLNSPDQNSQDYITTRNPPLYILIIIIIADDIFSTSSISRISSIVVTHLNAITRNIG